MAKPIKETPVLRGTDATRFLHAVNANEQKDHSAAFSRAKTIFDQFATDLPRSAHATHYAR